jgi:DnaK suppressor protein
MAKGEDQAARLARLAREAHERAEAHDLAADGGEASDAHHHPAEAATDAEARERELRAHLRLREEEERLLRLAEAAQRGEYGICIDCGQAIPEARLEIVPDAERCVACQEAASGGRRR